jgi:hypothetical protein
MREDEEVLASPRDGWQDFLQRLATVCVGWR